MQQKNVQANIQSALTKTGSTTTTTEIISDINSRDKPNLWGVRTQIEHRPSDAKGAGA